MENKELLEQMDAFIDWFTKSPDRFRRSNAPYQIKWHDSFADIYIRSNKDLFLYYLEEIEKNKLNPIVSCDNNSISSCISTPYYRFCKIKEDIFEPNDQSHVE
jgi:hypothetical protein